uniref:DUF7804 domain-containing protein n=1 Tax=Ananas comosus var. bracteatus TaxID=296719 RepID=A0A6V7QB48_ANACO|nr:unnamed protein product [Ananas comosus var. bracteatus]
MLARSTDDVAGQVGGVNYNVVGSVTWQATRDVPSSNGRRRSTRRSCHLFLFLFFDFSSIVAFLPKPIASIDPSAEASADAADRSSAIDGDGDEDDDVPILRLIVGANCARCVDRVEEEKREPVSNEDLDMWMRDSIQEIVRNIGEAPFLVHIFSGGRGSGSGNRKGGVRLEKEKASPDSWPQITRRWDREGGTPDGVILVEAIEEEDDERGPLLPPPTPPCAAAGPNSACKTWGWWCRGGGWTAPPATCSTPAASGRRSGSALTSASCGPSASARRSSRRSGMLGCRGIRN